MNWMDTFNAAFFLTISTILIGFLSLAIRTCLKSKCEDFSCCWGLVRIERRVDLEANIESNENILKNQESKKDFNTI